MRITLVVACLALNGCALAGVYGPEAQARAQASLVALGKCLDSAGAAWCNGVAAAAQARADCYHSYSESWEELRARQAAWDTQRRLDDIASAQQRMQNDLDTQESRARLERLGIRLP